MAVKVTIVADVSMKGDVHYLQEIKVNTIRLIELDKADSLVVLQEKSYAHLCEMADNVNF